MIATSSSGIYDSSPSIESSELLVHDSFEAELRDHRSPFQNLQSWVKCSWLEPYIVEALLSLRVSTSSDGACYKGPLGYSLAFVIPAQNSELLFHTVLRSLLERFL